MVLYLKHSHDVGPFFWRRKSSYNFAKIQDGERCNMADSEGALNLASPNSEPGKDVSRKCSGTGDVEGQILNLLSFGDHATATPFHNPSPCGYLGGHRFPWTNKFLCITHLWYLMPIVMILFLTSYWYLHTETKYVQIKTIKKTIKEKRQTVCYTTSAQEGKV